MLVVRGRAATVEEDQAVTRRLLSLAGTRGEPAVRVWRPHRHVAFGPRDVRHEGFTLARRHAELEGFTAAERSVGGHPVAFTGSTVAFTHVVPVDNPRTGLTERYDAILATLDRALAALGVDATPGEPPDSFCPGSYSRSADGKLLGVAQRVTAEAAAVAGVLVIDDEDQIGSVLEPIYTSLGLSFDPASVGSLVAAGGPTDGRGVVRTLEDHLVGERRRSIVQTPELRAEVDPGTG